MIKKKAKKKKKKGYAVNASRRSVKGNGRRKNPHTVYQMVERGG